MKYIFSIVVLLLAGWVQAQRVVMPLNNGWEFTKDIHSIENSNIRTAGWRYVVLPHTWNVEDVMDDTPGYYRGVAWYRKKIELDKTISRKELYLFFEGANQQITVFVNGREAGSHIGGYTAFYISLSAFLHAGEENELLIKADNSYNRNIPPLTADFTFYGGIYRRLSLVAVEPVHFACNDDGSKSVFISTPVVNKDSAEIHIKTNISSAGTKPVRISSVIYDASGKLVRTITTNALISSSETNVEEQTIRLAQPKLWSPGHPYLYKIVTRIIDPSTGKILDEVSNPLGFRWFHFDAEKGFFLNGAPFKLIGTSRHQDFKGMGNAVPERLARKDVQLLKDMGGNFLRVAHYPQDPVVMQACDELGILASLEIPVVNEITETDSFYNNSLHMQVEMIRQNFNHPSVIIWCYMNEILLRPQFNDDKERQRIYFSNIAKLAKKLDSTTRKEDPSRYTMMANHGAYSRYRELGLTDIPMIVGWNLYAGWYGADMKGLPEFLDKFHKDYPSTPMMITEYGADADPRIRSNTPVRFDKSVEYATTFHQYYFQEIMKRPFVAGAMVWNLADFNSETRNETMPHINNKGLLEWDRTPKDPYYFYKAMLVKEPFIKILGAGLREGIADSLQLVQVANNFSETNLYINGRLAGNKTAENGITGWHVPFKNGRNSIRVTGQKNGKLFIDQKEIVVRLQPGQLSRAIPPFREINILLGAKRFFTDSSHLLWIPDQEYHAGSWGHIGGKPFKLPNGNLPYGTDKNITGTFDDPVYQTQQTGLSSYKLDVPDGEYELTLHFAELLGGKVQQLVYNLDAGGRTESSIKRIFDVVVNGEPVLEKFNIAEQYGTAVAVQKKMKVKAKNNKGITIEFKAIEGEPVLNAIQLKGLKIKD